MDRQATVDALRGSGVPMFQWNYRLPNFGPVGVELRSYLQSDELTTDIEHGVGLCLHGPANERVKIFAALCCECVLLQHTVRFVSLQTILSALNIGEGPMYSAIMLTRGLFVAGFCDTSIHFPYEGRERAMLEQFFMEHIADGKRLYLSSSVPSQEMVAWYSRDFIVNVTTVLRDIGC